MTTPLAPPVPGKAEFLAAHARVREHAYHTPLLTSRTLSAATGFDVRLKAELYRLKAELKDDDRYALVSLPTGVDGTVAKLRGR